MAGAAGIVHRSTTTMAQWAAATTTTNREDEAATPKLKPKPHVDDEDNKQIILPRAFQWIVAASSSSPPTLTIAEANRRSGTRRAFFWVCSVYVPCVCVGATSIHRKDHVFPRSAAWRPPAVVVWGVYMALVMELAFYMSLFLLRAPEALREAVVNVGVACVGVPLGWIVILAACAGGQTWIGVVLAAVFAALFAAVVALWVWLVRTYAGPGRDHLLAL